MPIEVSIREIRKQLLIEAAGLTPGDDRIATIAELTGAFHDTVAALFSTKSRLFVNTVLEDVVVSGPTWKAALVDAVYRELVGPLLERDRAVLSQLPEEVASFWDATVRLCDWVTRLLLDEYRKHGSLDATRSPALCEQLLRAELREPSWRDSVILTGRADALVRVPDTSDWCVVMLRTVGMPNNADSAMAALYGMLLPPDERPSEQTRVVSFTPEIKERLITADELRATRARVKATIGRIAGVESPAAGDGPRVPSRKWTELTPQHLAMQKDLLRVLGSYGLAATLEGPPLLGPTFIRFLVRPAEGAKVAHFTGLTDEIALGMSLRHLPMIERCGGLIAVDVERPDRFAVPFADLRQLLPPTDPLQGNSQVLVGVDLEGRPVFIDLAKPEHCHVLVVGTAGSGKSIWLRAAIASLVETNTPATLQLLLIDPKRNAFTAWRDSPYLREPLVFPDDTPPLGVLEGLIDEMEDRYRRMAEADVDDLRGLIRFYGRTIPRIICACDEYADLVAESDERREIEAAIARLGAKARAAGIHLILATQTPRRDIISGTIKANLPTCIGLRVSSSAEARIIETPGAELLLGYGDLILKAIGDPRRLQGVLIPAGNAVPEPVAVG